MIIDSLRRFLNFCGVLPFRALPYEELDLLSLGEGLVPVADDVGVMDEQILPTILGGDETVTFLVVEPLYGPFLFGHGVLLQEGRIVKLTGEGK